MAGTRSAPTIDGTPVSITLSVQLMDSDGTKRAIDFELPATVTNAQMEDVVAKLQLATNATIYSAVVNYNYSSNAVATNALVAVQQSARNNIVILFKDDVALKTQEVYIPAPLNALFVAGTKNIDITNTVYGDYRNAVDVAIGADYAPVSVRYTERRQINQKQNRAG